MLTRYIINGLVATAVHFLVLVFNLRVLELRPIGVANAIAALFGIAVSFFGSRHFVFRATHAPAFAQAWRFLLLYGAIAVMHGLVLYAWSDVGGLDYRAGFAIATAIQVASSYLGNKRMVFVQ